MKKILLFVLLIILIPLLLTNFKEGLNTISKLKYGIYSNKQIRVKRLEKNRIDSVSLEDYVTGVVAGEMPASFSDEALKAQAVASRTYVLKRMINSNGDYDVVDSVSNQVYLDDDDMKKKWNNKYDEYLKKIKDVVLNTRGEVILYKNNLIDAMFFSTSNGYTENSVDVFSGDLPYLKSVDSKWDENESPSYKSTVVVSKKDFLSKLSFDVNSDIKINIDEKTSTGRVKFITINDKKFKGTQIRSTFGLKSTSFNITIDDNNVVFNVLGFGHGVGMSQYGANGMAKNGYSYKDILKHYYSNCDIKKIN